MSILVKMSSKGQLVIPRSVRQALRLSPGARFRLEVIDRKIVLRPEPTGSAVESLFGRFSGLDLLGELEREHREEVERDSGLRA